MKRIVVTGLGTVNPLANDVQTTWDKLIAGESGIGKIDKFPIDTYRCQIGGLVKNFDHRDYYSEETLSKAKRLDVFCHYAIAAAKEAIAMANLEIKTNPYRVGITVGSGIGGMEVNTANSKVFHEKGNRRFSPFHIPALIGNMASGFLSMEHGIKGPSYSLQTACATGNHSIICAYMMIQSGLIDACLAGGSEGTMDPMALAGFDNMRALSSGFNDTPTKASRPFDKDRDGFVMSEGAGILVLEEYEHAKKRNANIICEIAGFGMTSDAYDMVMPRPDGRGGLKCMKLAIENAGIKSTDLNYINAHGTSTPLGDVAETKAIHELVDGDQTNLTVGSTKSMTGHMLGAVAGLEAIVVAMAIKESKIPPTINLDSLDEQIKLDCINTTSLDKKINYGLSNSFGFGGHNSSIILKHV